MTWTCSGEKLKAGILVLRLSCIMYKDHSAPTQKPENWWKLGASRPIINMNPAKWIQSGKIIIPQNGYNYNGISSTIVGNADVWSFRTQRRKRAGNLTGS